MSDRITWKLNAAVLETLHIVLPAPAGERYAFDPVPAMSLRRLVLVDDRNTQRYPFSGEGMTAAQMNTYLRGLMDARHHAELLPRVGRK